MATAMVGLGALRFEIDALNFTQLERTFAYRWEPQNRLGRRPAMQFMGPGEETVTLTGTTYPNHPAFAGGLAELNAMRSRSEVGAFFTMGARVGTRGLALGRWCVRNIRDVQSYFHPSGQPSKVEFTIELVAYGSDGNAALGFF
jgi:uncharacterized protein